MKFKIPAKKIKRSYRKVIAIGIILLFFAIGILTDRLLLALALMLGVTGLYLIIKGFGVEERFFTMISEFLKSLSPERISFLTYLTSAMILIIGAWNGWHAYINNISGG